MASATFRGGAIFDSGPCYFVPGVRGRIVLPSYRLGGIGSDPVVVGPMATEVAVRGRLIADDEAGLAQLIATVEEEIDPVRVGLLFDGRSRTWDFMSLVAFERSGAETGQPGEPWRGSVDRGRKVSCGYVMRFMDLRGGV